jgi:hypothetical protein
VRKRLGKKIDTDALRRHSNQLNRTEKGLEKRKIEDAAHWIQTCIEDAAKPGPEGKQAKPWFDQECYHRRKETLAKLHKTRQSKSLEDIDKYRQSRSQYKQMVIRKRKVYIKKPMKQSSRRQRQTPTKRYAHVNKGFNQAYPWTPGRHI